MKRFLDAVMGSYEFGTHISVRVITIFDAETSPPGDSSLMRWLSGSREPRLEFTTGSVDSRRGPALGTKLCNRRLPHLMKVLDQLCDLNSFEDSLRAVW